MISSFRNRLAPFVFLAVANPAAAAPDFQKDVGPIFRQYCLGCHNQEDFEGDLSLETYADLLAGGESGEPSLIPGDAKASFLLKTVRKEEKPRMPPSDEPQPTPEEVAILEDWVAAGAKGPANAEDRSLLSTLIVPEVKAGKHPLPITAADVRGDLRALARYGVVEIGKTRITDLPGKVNAVRISPDGKLLVTASGITGVKGLATLWDVASGRRIADLIGPHRDTLFAAEFSPDGKLLATAGYDFKVVIWDIARREPTQVLDIHTGAVFDLAFSPDSKLLASASADETTKIWRVADGTRMDTLSQPQGEQFATVFSPDGKQVFTAGADNRIRSYRVLPTDKPRIYPLLHARFAHEDTITALAIDPGGEWIASAANDGSIKRWSLPDLEVIEAFENQSDVVTALLPRGDSLLVTRMDGSTGELALADRGAGARPDTVDRTPARSLSTAEPSRHLEFEPNNTPEEAFTLDLPAIIDGAFETPDDRDLFRFKARAGEEWVLEVEAEREGFPVDSFVSVHHPDGRPVERVVLQAVRDSWFTFRGKDSRQSGDFRIHNWEEMTLNEYLYCNGEVVRLWLYPRGPDSGFDVYPGKGNRRTYFGTTPRTHALGEICYVVRPLSPGADPVPNGLPVFRIPFENDDEPNQRFGKDSRLLFTAPEDGEYLASIRDRRGLATDESFYRLHIRPRAEDFSVSKTKPSLALAPGSGREIAFTATREDDFDGPITIDIEGLPEGFSASTPVLIGEGQRSTQAVVFAEPGAPAPPKDAHLKTRVTATAEIRGEREVKDLGSLGALSLGAAPKLQLAIIPDDGKPAAGHDPNREIELTIKAGSTVTARVLATRHDFKQRIELGKEDAGRGLPHGIYVDNIGLNGLLIVGSESERQFFLTADPWVPEGVHRIYLRTGAAGGVATRPVTLRVVR